VVGTSVANIWNGPAADLAAAHAELAAEYPQRFLLGLGAGHASQVSFHQGRYARPLQALAEYLDDWTTR
jgi:alkanesulfonate monooxygenase SsuD/methylene tetrahydromethanopterin reductase-like flavin-dependent oxidoreductase (luciferase family)